MEVKTFGSREKMSDDFSRRSASIFKPSPLGEGR